MSFAEAAELLSRPRPSSSAPELRGLIELHPPISPSGQELVHRPQLVRRLVESQEVVLVLIVAPAGYGKSALLSEWSQADPRPFVWLRAAEADSDPPGRSRGASFVGTHGGCFEPPRPEDAPSVFVIEDAHLLEPRMLRRLVTGMLPELPPGSALAVSSRNDPDLPLALLRSHRVLAEIGVGHLAMGPLEATELLQRAGLEPSAAEVRALLARTEGWPAAMYLEAASEADTAFVSVPGVAVGGHGLASYLQDEVLSAIPPRLMRTARRSAILDEVSAASCNAVLLRHGCGRDLAELAKLMQLLLPVDHAPGQYRWHPLVREALLTELRNAEPELEQALHSRASDWYLERGDIDLAVVHACEAHDAVRAGVLLWPRLPHYLMTGRTRQVEMWLRKLTEGQIARSPRLAAAAAHCALWRRDLDTARRRELHAVAALAHHPDDVDVHGLRAGIALLGAMTAATDAAAMRSAAAHACDAESADSLWRPISHYVSGTAAYLAGDSEHADADLADAAACAGRHLPALTALALSQRATVALQREDWEAAADHSSRALAIVSEWGLEREPLAVLVFAAAAASEAHDKRSDDAKRHLRASLELLAEPGDVIAWHGAEVRILLAFAQLWLADVVGARTLLAQASRLARRTRGTVVFQHWFDSAWSQMDSFAEASLAGPSALTVAELKVLRFLPSHLSFREIAGRLGVSANTVKTQAHGVYRKLGAASRSEAVARAQEVGLIQQ